jgi:hypothetical protein
MIMARIDLPTLTTHARSLMRAGPCTGASAADLRAATNGQVHLAVVRANSYRFSNVRRRSYQNIWWCEGQRKRSLARADAVIEQGPPTSEIGT